ncbi:MAG TPA: VTT domain-containing protein [Bacteroidia bacterium]|nr:VTT domain-containing protein [Bacteroidia bacterium]
MSEALEFLKTLTNPESIVKLGLPLLLFVIFAETGLLIGFFLPGDSLVFISGLLCATNQAILKVSITELILYMSLAAVIGNTFGYFFGKKVGEGLYKRKDSLLFKKRHLETTRNFYERHGGKTLFVGRFLPIIRTFAPILAGVIKIDFKKFMLYNIVGALCWIGSVAGIGYFLGAKFPQTKDYLGYIVIGLIVITSIPVLVTYFKERKSN